MTTLQKRLFTAAFAGAALLLIEPTSAQAQNTYADAPFNQGSLFYRPSGRKPAKTVVVTPATVVAAPVYTTVVPTAGVYVAPRTATRVYSTRRRLFGPRYYVPTY